MSSLIFSTNENSPDEKREIISPYIETMSKLGIVESGWQRDEWHNENELSHLDADISCSGYSYDNTYCPSAEGAERLIYPLFVTRWHTTSKHYTKRKGWQCYELIYTDSGAGELEVGDRTYRLEPGSLALLDCRDYHSYRADDPSGWEYTYIHFDGTTSDALFRRAHEKGDVFTGVGRTKVGRCVDRIVNLANDNPADFDVLFHGNMTELLVTLASQESTRQDQPEWMTDIKAYIGEHYYEDLTPKDLAQRAYLSESRFSHLFKESTGMPPIEYRNAVRIERAKELLLNTEQSAEQIGAEVGFNSTSSFYAKFSQITGMSPGAWRRAQRGETCPKVVEARTSAAPKAKG